MGKVKSKFKGLAVLLSALMLFLSVPVEGMLVYADEVQAEEEIVDNDNSIVDETTVSGNVGEDNDEHENIASDTEKDTLYAIEIQNEGNEVYDDEKNTIDKTVVSGNEEEVNDVDFVSQEDLYVSSNSVEVDEDCISEDVLYNAEDIASGENGDIIWRIDANGKLIVTGKGKNQGFFVQPWRDYRNEIKSAEIELSECGNLNGLFSDCNYLSRAVISIKDTSNLVNVSHLFNNCSSIEDIVFNFSAANVTNMEGMFSGCSSLKSIDLSNFDTSNVFNMGDMFAYCSSLEQLDLTLLNTSQVVYMDSMFSGCSSLKSIDLSNFDTSNVFNMRDMFSGCSSLKSIDLSNFDTSNVQTMDSMFEYCYKLENITGIGDFQTGTVVDMSSMFCACRSIKTLDLSSWNVSNVTDMRNMFDQDGNNFSSDKDIHSLEQLNLSGWDTSSVENMRKMFNNCDKLRFVDVSGWDVSQVKSFESMFEGCKSLETLDVSKWNTSSLKELRWMFSECSNINKLDVSNWNVSAVIDFASLFYNMNKIEELDVSNWNMSNAENISNMFEKCESLKEIDLSGWNTSSIHALNGLFGFCYNLEYINGFDHLDISNISEFDYVFEYCKSLNSIDLSKFDFSKIKNANRAFRGCSSLALVCSPQNVNCEVQLPENGWKRKDTEESITAIPIGVDHSIELYRVLAPVWSIDANGVLTVSGVGDVKKENGTWPWYGQRNSIKSAVIKLNGVTDLKGFFKGCEKLQSVDLRGLDTSNVTSMSDMFSGCSSLKSVDLSGFNTGNVTEMGSMFQECTSLESVNLSSFNTEKVYNMGAMFWNCYSLKQLNISNFDTSNVTWFNSMFLGCKSLEQLDVSGFRTSKGNAESLIAMFSGCESLSEIDVSHFDISGAQSLTAMFRDCKSLKKVDLSGFEASKITTAYYLFTNCTSLVEIHTPRNLNLSVELPGSVWKRSDTGAVVTELPKNSNVSIELTKEKERPAITKIELEIANGESSRMIKGDEITINAIITPDDGDTSKITWTTSNNNVATVAGSGASAKVVAVGEGTTTITAAAGKVTATATVTVSQPVKFDKHELSLVAKPGSQAIITATVTGKGYTTADLEWSSSDPGVATVDKGVVTANADLAETKTATIKAIIKGTEYSDSCLVTVNVAGAAMAPTATPVGEVEKNTRVILNSETVGADIYYTTDGSVPSVDATGKPQGTTKLYTDAIIIDKTITVKAFATCEGYKDSQVVSFVYTIKQEWGDVANYASVMQLFADSSYIPEGIWYVMGDKVYTESDASDVIKNYTGAKITFNDEIQVFHETRKLWENRDYTISYKNNQNVAGVNDGNKAPAVSIKGKGSYTKTSEFKFTIAATDINEAELTSEKTLCVNAGTKLNSIKPVLMFEGKKLGVNKDYSLTYTCGGNAVSADTKTEAGKTYEISISGKASFKNAHNKKIVVKVIDTKNKDVISMSKVKVTIPKQEWKKGQPVDVEKLFKDGVATVNNGKDRLEYGTDRDFTVDAASYDGAGKYNIAIHGTGRTGEGVKSYVGDKNAVLEITGIPAGKIKVSGLASNIEYTGKAYILPAGVKLTSTAGDLKEGTDYTVEIHDSGAVGKVNIVFTLKGQYTGIIKKTVNVKAKSIAGAVVTATAAEYSKAGAIPATVTVKLGDKVLREGIDYTLSYSNNAKAGVMATVTAKGIGNYTGMATAGFRVNKSEITESVTLVAADKVYNAKAKAGYFKSAPKLMDGSKAISVGKDIDKINTKTAFRYYYANTGEEIPNNAVVAANTTIEVRVTVNCSANSPYKQGQYELKGYYKILDAGKDIKSAKVVMKNKNIQFNNGKAIIPLKESDLVVTVGKTVLKSTDYEIVSIRNNRFLGTATVEIRGKGQFGGSKTFTFKINAKALK